MSELGAEIASLSAQLAAIEAHRGRLVFELSQRQDEQWEVRHACRDAWRRVQQIEACEGVPA